METRSKKQDLEHRMRDLEKRIQQYKSCTAFSSMAAQTLEKRRVAMSQSLSALREEAGELEDRDDDGCCTKNDPGLVLVNKSVPNYDYTATGFVIVLLWVALFTYLMSDAATRFGCTTSIPSFPMGLIFLAAGTS